MPLSPCEAAEPEKHLPKKPKPPTDRKPPKAADASVETELRIIGGQWRGTRLAYHGDPVTRPMKHRVREAIFNLVGPAVEGKHALDVFAGTGALALEALSRGAASATLIERHIPTAAVVKQNIAAVGAEDRTELLVTSAFLWSKRDLPKAETGNRKPEEADSGDSAFRFPLSGFPWLAFVSPPYAFFVDRQQEMLDLIAGLIQYAPEESLIVVEADERFDFSLLPGGVRQDRHSAGWDVREYPPAVVGVWRCGNDD